MSRQNLMIMFFITVYVDKMPKGCATIDQYKIQILHGAKPCHAIKITQKL